MPVILNRNWEQDNNEIHNLKAPFTIIFHSFLNTFYRKLWRKQITSGNDTGIVPFSVRSI